MSRVARYAIYFIIGILIYYGLEANDDPELLEKVRKHAPIAILVIFVALLIVQYIRSRQERD